MKKEFIVSEIKQEKKILVKIPSELRDNGYSTMV